MKSSLSGFWIKSQKCHFRKTLRVGQKLTTLLMDIHSMKLSGSSLDLCMLLKKHLLEYVIYCFGNTCFNLRLFWLFYYKERFRVGSIPINANDTNCHVKKSGRWAHLDGQL